MLPSRAASLYTKVALREWLVLTISIVHASVALGIPLQPNDPKYDNGPALSDCCRRSIAIPSGVYYVRSTIETGVDHGGKLTGVGRSCEEMPESVYFNQPVTVLVWNGAPGGTLLHVQRQGFVVEDIALQGASWKKNWDPRGTGSLVDIEQATGGDQNHQRPCGNITFTRVSFLAAGYGVRVIKSDHGDHIALRDCVSEGVNIVYQSNEPQSVECYVDHLTCKLDGKYVFDFRAGGRFQCNHVVVTGKWDAVLSLGDAAANSGPDINSNYYDLFVFADNAVRNLCLVKEQTANHPAIVNVHGYMASRVTPADPPVVQLNKKSRINVDIDVLWSWTGQHIVWPESGK